MPTAFPVTVTSLVPKACFFTFAPPLAPSKCERASQQTASWGQAVSAHCCPGHWLLPPPQPPLRSGTGPFSRRCAYAQFSCLLCLIQSSPTVPGSPRSIEDTSLPLREAEGKMARPQVDPGRGRRAQGNGGLTGIYKYSLG